MRAITIQQPWAWAIFCGGKDVENRADRRGQAHARKRWNVLGEHVVHTSQRDAGRAAYETVKELSTRAVHHPGGPGNLPQWAYGSLIGVVTVTGVHEADQCMDPVTGRFCSPWAEPDAAHIQLASPRLLHRPIPAHGQLGPWAITDALVLAELRRQLS